MKRTQAILFYLQSNNKINFFNLTITFVKSSLKEVFKESFG